MESETSVVPVARQRMRKQAEIMVAAYLKHRTSLHLIDDITDAMDEWSRITRADLAPSVPRETVERSAKARDKADAIVSAWEGCITEIISEGSLAELSDRIAAALNSGKE